MSILNKLTVGALAVLGAFALGGKRRESEAPDDDKQRAKRRPARKPGAKAKTRTTAGHSAARAAKRAAPKAKAEKRSHRTTRAKRTHST